MTVPNFTPVNSTPDKMDCNHIKLTADSNNSPANSELHTLTPPIKSINTSDIDSSDVDSDITDPVLPQGCDEVRCSYGGSKRYPNDIYKCTKCPCHVCEPCKVGGAHSGHRKYLELDERHDPR